MAKRKTERSEREIILEFINLGRGHLAEKEKLAAELGISLSTLKYRVKKFKNGEGIGRKKRRDAGIPKKEPELRTKLAFFAELAMGKSADQAGAELGLTEHQTNRLSKEFAKQDKWRALRNAPQLDDLRELVKDILRLDIAIVDAEMNGAFKAELKDRTIVIPVEELKDIQNILAHCIQRDEMAKIDPAFANLSKDDLINIRVAYLKEYFLEKKNAVDFARLERATKISTPERQLDLDIAYALIDHFKPGLDETAKIKILRSIVARVKAER